MTTKAIFDRNNIIITGGAGFIGSYLCDELIKKNKVICIDNFISGREENIDHLLRNPYFEFIRHDISEPIDLEKLPELKVFKVEFQGIQEVYNLACPTSPKEYNKFPIETLVTNSHGTKNALEFAVKYEAKFLHLSTAAIYGEPTTKDKIFPEDYWGFVDPVGPRSCYNEGKRFAESMVFNYQQKYNLDAKIARVFNTFGPRMKLTDGRMIPDFIKAAINNEDIEIYGKGEETSTYLYITDVIEAIEKIMGSAETGPVNIGNPKEYKIIDIAKTIIQLTDSKSEIVFRDPIPYLAKQGIPDISTMKEKVGWFPVVELEEGLRKTIAYMRGSKVLSYRDIAGVNNKDKDEKEEEDKK